MENICSDLRRGASDPKSEKCLKLSCLSSGGMTNLSDLEARMKEAHQDISGHMDSITDPEERTREAVHLHMYRTHSPHAHAELQTELPQHYTQMYSRVVDHLEKKHEGRKGFHPDVVGEDIGEEEREKWAEEVLDEILGYVAERRFGKTVAKTYRLTASDDEDLTEGQRAMIKQNRKVLVQQLTGDKQGDAYENLLRQLMNSKNLIADIKNNEHPLYQTLQKFAQGSSDYAAKGAVLNEILGNVLRNPEMVSGPAVETFNEWAKTMGFEYGISPKYVQNADSLLMQSDAFGKYGPDGIKTAALDGSSKHLYEKFED